MSRALALLLLAACSDGGTDGDDAEAAVALRFAVEADEDLFLDQLALRVDELVLLGDGPDGAVSLSHTGGTMVSLLDAGTQPAEVVLHMPPGTYEDVHTTVHLRPEGSEPALVATGVLDEQDFQLVVTMEVGLQAEVGSMELGEGEEVDLTYRLRPDEWLGELEEVEPTGDDLLIDATHNAPLYFEIVEELEESTDASLGEADA